tara:strand:+ start:538 stop:1089 length:552 start_codon:yes stop_codon:yes gene_type:complete
MKKTKIFFLLIMFTLFSSVSNAAYKKLAYDFSFNDLDGTKIKLSEFKNNVLVITNVASKCGFTSQYEDLQTIWEKYQKDGLVVIGVPSNSFNQEPGSNEEVKNFCEAKFGISFPMTQKAEVKGENAHPFFKWANENYGKKAIPKWNFHKIIVGKDGKIFGTFSSITNPTSKKFITSIEEALKK